MEQKQEEIWAELERTCERMSFKVEDPSQVLLLLDEARGLIAKLKPEWRSLRDDPPTRSFGKQVLLRTETALGYEHTTALCMSIWSTNSGAPMEYYSEWKEIPS